MSEYKNILFACIACVAVWAGYEAFLKPKEHVVIKEQEKSPVHSTSSEQCFISDNEALEEPRVALSNALVEAKIRLRGAVLDRWALKKYMQTTTESLPVQILHPYGTRHGYYVFSAWSSPNSSVILPNEDTIWSVQPSSSDQLFLRWKSPQGIRFEQDFTLHNAYTIALTQRVHNGTKHPVSIKTVTQVIQQAPVETAGHWLSYEGPIAVCDKVLKNVSYKNLEKASSRFERTNWAGIGDKYWLVALIDVANRRETYFSFDTLGRIKNTYRVALEGNEETIAPNHVLVNRHQNVFLGPKEVGILDEYQRVSHVERFDLAVDFGWFYFITKPVFYILSFFKSWLGSFAAAILLLTVCVRILFFPLAVKSAKSMASMQRLQPTLMLLKERFKDDKVKLNQAIMEVYREKKINPFSGIWPILLQGPLFFALYKVLFISIEMRHAPFWGWIQDLSAPDPTSVLGFFGLLPIELPAALTIGAWPVLMGITMVLQQRLSSQKNASLDPSQQWILSYGLPILFVYMMAQFPVGLIIYWTWNNILAILQQFIIRYFDLTGDHV